MLVNLLLYSDRFKSVDDDFIEEIIYKASSYNYKNEITGVLLCSKTNFIQLLEGDIVVIYDLFKKIKYNQSHSKIIILSQSQIPNRAFNKWYCSYINEKNNIINSFKTDYPHCEFKKHVIEGEFINSIGLSYLQKFYQQNFN
jgi:hypothetical protein